MKKKVLLVFGGNSDEHEVSLRSAKAVLKNLNLNKYEVYLLAICRNNDQLFCGNPEEIALIKNSPETSMPIKNEWPIAYITKKNEKPQIQFANDNPSVKFDVILPILHGPNGEDGRLQGYLELKSIPFAGCGMYASAVCMDKAIFKDVLSQNNISQAKYLWFYKKDFLKKTDYYFEKILNLSGEGIFIKPSRMGSSVGISKLLFSETSNKDSLLKELLEKIKIAGNYDSKIVIEELISGKELEFSVIGNDELHSAGPGEIITEQAEFYTYDAKYKNANDAKVNLNPKLPVELKQRGNKLAKDVFSLTECKGFARVDMFYCKDKFLVNEINTLPGFTEISLFPQLLINDGWTFAEVLDKILELALA